MSARSFVFFLVILCNFSMFLYILQVWVSFKIPFKLHPMNENAKNDPMWNVRKRAHNKRSMENEEKKNVKKMQ